MYVLITQEKGEKVSVARRLRFSQGDGITSTAVQACREMPPARSPSLCGGTDQIQACGRFAESSKFPYFSPGVTENGLSPAEVYYAASMSYKQQGVLLAQ